MPTNQVGRPTKYEEEFIAKADEYLSSCNDEEYRVIKSDGDKTTSWENKIRVHLPKISDFALMLGVNKTTLYEWAKKHKDFSNALEKIKTKQRQRLINSGLSGDYNPTIAKLMLSSNHGMVERSDMTSDGESLIFQIVRHKE